MSADITTLLLSFKPDEQRLQSNLEYDKAARTFVSKVSYLKADKFLEGADTERDVLEVLDPSVNTIAYAFALIARIAAAWEKPKQIPETFRPGGHSWNKICLFFETADPVQLRYVGVEWKRIADYVEKFARQLGVPHLAIAPMRSALFRLDPTTGTLTWTHMQFIRLCLDTRQYAAAVPVLDNYIYSLPSAIPALITNYQEYAVSAADFKSSGEYIHTRSGHTDKLFLNAVQEYYVLGAKAYIGVKQYKKARDFLEHVLVAPSTGHAASGYMLEAYRTWALVCCLVDGSASPVPRTADSIAIRNVKNASKAYDALVEAFVQFNNPKLKAQIIAGKDIWAEDGNTGLVTQLLYNHHKFFIARLSKTYSAIPVSKISAQLGGTVSELVDYLGLLIKEGQLNAQLEKSDKPELGDVLRFFMDPTQGPMAKTEKQQQQALYEQTVRNNALAEHVKSADYRLSLGKEHVEHIRKMNKKKEAQAAEAMDTSWGDGQDPTLDEDIMGEL